MSNIRSSCLNVNQTRSIRLDALMPDAQPTQCKGEAPGSEDGFVVGPDLPRFAVMLGGVQQQPQKGDRGFLAQYSNCQDTATAVVDDPLRDHRCSVVFGHVDAPGDRRDQGTSD